MGIESEKLHEDLQNDLDDLSKELYGLLDQSTKVKSNLENTNDQKENKCSIITLKLIKRQIFYLQERIKYIAAEDGEYGVQLQELNEQIEYEEKILKGLKQQIETNNEALEETEKAIEDKKVKLKELKKKTTAQNSTLKNLKEDIISQKNELSHLDKDIIERKRDLEELEREINIAQQAIESLKEQKAKNRQVLEEAEQEITSKRTLLEGLDKEKGDAIIEQLSDSDSLCSTETIEKEIEQDSYEEDNYIGSYNIKYSDRSLFEELNAATKQEKIMANEETQTPKEQKLWYVMYFTIPFTLVGTSLTIISLTGLERNGVNNSVLLSIGLSIAILSIIYCFITIKFYECYEKPISDLDSLKELKIENDINFTGENIL